MKIIKEQDIENLQIPSQACLAWVEEALKVKDQAILPAKTSMKLQEDIFCNVMPSVIPHARFGKVGGVKVVSRYPGRTPTLDGKLLLFNAENGEYLALMDANWITTTRTAAVAVHSVKLLAKKNFSKVAVIGLGEITRATVRILLDTTQDRDLVLRVYDYKGRGRAFAELYKDYANVTFEYYEDVMDCVRGSEVVLSAPTYLKDDICTDDCFDEGVLVVPIHTRGFTNCDLFFEKVFADDYNHVHHFKYFDKFRSFAEVADVITGKKVGRENDKERILAYNIGISLHDVYYAANVYEYLQEK